MIATCERLTIGDLCRLEIVTREELHALADSYLTGPTSGLWEISDGIYIDVTAAVEADFHTKQVLARSDVSPLVREILLCTAILMARPK